MQSAMPFAQGRIQHSRAHSTLSTGLPRLSTPHLRFHTGSVGVAHASSSNNNNNTTATEGVLPSSTATIVTDSSVPEGHRGLHSLLYGEGGAEEAHGSPSSSSTTTSSSSTSSGAAYTFHDGEDDGTAIVPVDAYLDSRDGERPVGVFALFDARRNLQYVGYSRNVVLSVRTIQGRVGEERCAFLRVMVFANKAMQSRATLQREADNWLSEAGTLPPGNGAEAELWSGTEATFDVASMSEEEAKQYEEKKQKMQRAMGEIKGADVGEDENITNEQRSANTRAAMEQGDWSAVVNAQTDETLQQNNKQKEEAAAAAAPIVTPFARASVHRSVGNTEADTVLEMTVDSVDKVLDDVRPYLIADGGNVEVVAVENGIIALQLQGACGTCPSSTATMKMGIERSLRSAFGDQVKEVVSLGGPVDTAATVESVDAHLNMLRGAITAYGGGVEVVEVNGGRVVLRYNGPKPIGYGMVAAVKDKFHDLKEVVLLDMESGEPIEF